MYIYIYIYMWVNKGYMHVSMFTWYEHPSAKVSSEVLRIGPRWWRPAWAAARERAPAASPASGRATAAGDRPTHLFLGLAVWSF